MLVAMGSTSRVFKIKYIKSFYNQPLIKTQWISIIVWWSKLVEIVISWKGILNIQYLLYWTHHFWVTRPLFCPLTISPNVMEPMTFPALWNLIKKLLYRGNSLVLLRQWSQCHKFCQWWLFSHFEEVWRKHQRAQ